MDSTRRPDAFSQTLDADLRKRRTSAALKTPPSERGQHGRIGSVNRLSRAFESDERAKPKPPAKPPSLRITPSAPSSRPPPPPSLPRQTLHSPPAPTTISDAVDETPLAFSDIRARFQQHTNETPPKPSLSPARQTIRVAKPIISPPPPRAATPNGHEARPRPLVAELSQRLEKQQQQQELQKHPLTLPSETISPTTYVSAAHPRQTMTKRPSNPSLPMNPQAMLARSGTASSILSSTSSSSTSSTAATPSSKGTWHGYSLTSWLTGGSASDDPQHPSPKKSITVIRQPTGDSNSPLPIPTSSNTSCTGSLPVSPQLSGNGPSRSFKRSKVVQELLDTEKVYQSDMQLLHEIYCDPTSADGSPFTKHDRKVLFPNLSTVLRLEATFVPILEKACHLTGDGPDSDEADGTTVGSAFLQEMSTIEQVYSEYCKKHDDAVLRLQDLESKPDIQAYLIKCKDQMQGRTTSWDLGSLLIKPVQRVLKYPLLLREIFMLTPAGHPDYEQLSLATKEIQQVADHINEIKRRKEIVEKIVGDKKKTEVNVVHGINKKITRRAQRFKQATGFAAEATQDDTFNLLNLQFEKQQSVAQQLALDVQQWVRLAKAHYENLKLFADSAETLYAMFGGTRVQSMEQVRAWSRMATQAATTLATQLDMLREGVDARIEDFMKIFENPSQVISKRSMKLLDYDRVRDMKSKGDVADKALQESADTYVSINAQLVDELPKFFALSARYFERVVGDIAAEQMRFYEHLCRKWQDVSNKYASKRAPGDGAYEEVKAHYREQMKHAVALADDISLLNRAQWTSSVSTPGEESLHYGSLRGGGAAMAQDGYFGGSSLSFTSVNDDDTRSTTSSRAYGSPRLNSRSGVAAGHGMDETVYMATTHYEDVHDEPEFWCEVLFDFSMKDAEYLKVQKGDTVLIKSSSDGDWWFGCQDNRKGWLPSSYCKKM